MTTYVIRANYFGYNDETFYVAGNRIANVFADQAQAEQTYRQLEIQDARDFALYEIESFFDASQEELQKFDDFVFSRCGQHLLENGELIEDTLPDELSDEDTFEFIQLAQMQKYQLIRFEDQPKFYAIWLPQQEKWIKQYDECFEGLIYSESPEQLKSSLELIFNEYGSGIDLQGTLADLSEQPILLQSTIAAQAGLSYDAAQNLLKIKIWNEEALYAVNSLLKQPIFEIRSLNVEEILQLEKGMMSEYEEEEYEE